MPRIFRNSLLLIISYTCFSSFAGAWGVKPEPVVLPNFIDHSSWQQLLDLYLRKDPMTGTLGFDYAAVTPESKQLLAAYIDELADRAYWLYSPEEQQAYWLNLYNALVVQLILNLYPIDSVDQIPVMPGSSYLDLPLVQILETPMSLRDIERLLSVEYRDAPKLQFAMSCGSQSCPDLAERAYEGMRLQEQLSLQMERFASRNSNVHFDVNNQLVLSHVLERYQSYQIEDQPALLRRLAYYAPTMVALKLLGYTGSVRYEENPAISGPRL